MSYKTLFSKCYFFLLLIPSVAQTQNNTEISIRQYIDLSGQWQFSTDDKNVGLSKSCTANRLQILLNFPAHLMKAIKAM